MQVHSGQDRNRIIRNLLERGESRERICEELDRQSIPTLPSMQERGVHNWVQGWGDPEFRKAIQRMISKVAHAANLVMAAICMSLPKSSVMPTSR